MTAPDPADTVIEQAVKVAIEAFVLSVAEHEWTIPDTVRALADAGLLHTAQDDLDLWDAKRIKAERDELRATVERVRALADRWNTEWLESVRPEHRSKVRPAWAARGIWRALDGDEGEQ